MERLGIDQSDARPHPGTPQPMDAVEDTFEVVEQVRTRSETRPALRWATATPDETCKTSEGAGSDGDEYPRSYYETA